MFGREVDSPRLSCWIGDPEAVYTYSRTRFVPHPWPASLLPLRERLSDELGVAFNSVLANLYRDGRDRMGWHSDDEPELGPRPVIASVSLGATRRFSLKPRAGGASRHLDLPHGSLLVMAGDTQAAWRHALAGYRAAGGATDQPDLPAHPHVGKWLIRKASVRCADPGAHARASARPCAGTGRNRYNRRFPHIRRTAPGRREPHGPHHR